MNQILLNQKVTYVGNQIEIIPIVPSSYNFDSSFLTTYGKEFGKKVFCISLFPIPANFYIGFAIDSSNVDSYFPEFNRIDKLRNKLNFIIRIKDEMPDEFEIYYAIYTMRPSINTKLNVELSIWKKNWKNCENN